MATFTRPTDLNDRQAFYELGDKYEKAFVKKMRKKNYDVQINPDKETNKTAIDLLWDGKLVELKTRRTPFFKSGNYQIDPNHAVTINGKDIDNYAETPTLEVVFWVKWPAQTKYGVTVKAVNGVWFTTVAAMQQMIADGAPEHMYQGRINDNRANAKFSYIFDLQQMEEL